VKEQVKEEHVKSKGAEEETSRSLVETRRTRSVTTRKPALRPEKLLPKPQAPSTKAPIVFHIPIKSVRQPETLQPQPPRLKAKSRSFVKPKLLPVEAQPTTTITPTILIVPKTPADIKISTHTPTTLRRLLTPPLRLRLKLPSDISIRPVFRSEPIKDTEILIPFIRPTHIGIRRPQLMPSFIRKPSTVCMPRIRTIPVAEEEVEKERLALMQALKPEAEAGAVGATEPSRPEIENVLELFLEEKSGKGVGSAVSYSGEPVYLVLAKPYDGEHECLDALHYFCIRALREYLGSLPETRLLSSGYGRVEVERYLGERGITIVDEKTLSERLAVGLKKRVGEAPQLELALIELNEEALADRIKDIGKGLRYVIFHVKQHLAGSLYDKLWKFRSKFHDKIFWVEPVPLPVDLRRGLAELMWAFVDIPDSGSYDHLLGAGKIAYYNKLKRIGKIVSFKLERPYPIVRTHRFGPESNEHYLLKKFLAKCLVDKPQQYLNLSKIVREERYKHIEFEKEWWEENELVAVSDAYVENDEIAIEVETLFEEGKYGGDPVAKIRDETVEKYRRFNIPIRELWIVLENITMLRHLRELWALRNLYKRRHKEGTLSFEVKFFTLDLKNETLVQMEELVKCAREILKARSA